MKERKLIRTALQEFEGYVSGEQPQGEGWIKLNTNENPFPPPPEVAEVLRNFPIETLRKYPDAVCIEVRKEAAKIHGCSPDQVIVTNGSDEVLALILRCCMDPGDKVTLFYPSYTLYRTLALANGGKPEEIQLNPDFSLPKIDPSQLGQIIFIPNPNSPTGTLFPEENLKWLCENAPGVVVIDEAYAEFAGVSYVNWINKYDNCIVTRTLSKSYALCGIRMGFGFAGKAIMPILYGVKDSYNVNSLSQAVGLAALKNQEYINETVKKVVVERENLKMELEKRGFRVSPAKSNFILAECPPPGAKRIYETLKNQKILVRYFNAPRLDNSLRISIGLPEENQQLLKALGEIL